MGSTARVEITIESILYHTVHTIDRNLLSFHACTNL